MNSVEIHKNRLKNGVNTLFFQLLMGSLMLFLGWMIAGFNGIILVLLANLTLQIFSPYNSSDRMVRATGARPLPRYAFPQLFNEVAQIAKRADLKYVPKIYYLPSKMMNAFVMGDQTNASIVVSDSLLRNLNLRELRGIIGHEMAHIYNNDLQVMNSANNTVRITSFISLFGQISLLFALPAILFGEMQIAFFPLLLLYLSPNIAFFLQLALSRTREFEADRVGVQLAGDTYGLASALTKLEQFHRGFLSKMVLTPWRHKSPSLLQTHPPTKERVKRLLSMTVSERIQPGDVIKSYPRTSVYMG